jgi:hypothetical protein
MADGFDDSVREVIRGSGRWKRAERLQQAFLHFEVGLAFAAAQTVGVEFGILPWGDPLVKEVLESSFEGVTVHRRAPRRSHGSEAVPRALVELDGPKS